METHIAVIRAHIRRRWDAIALTQLFETLVRESEEVARLRSDVPRRRCPGRLLILTASERISTVPTR